MFKQIVLIILVLCAFGNQSAMAAVAVLEAAAAGAGTSSPRANLKTDNPLLFQLGNLYVLGTAHSLPITIFSELVQSFLETMKSHTHLIEHNEEEYDNKFLEKIGGAALTLEESTVPHLAELKKSLPGYMQMTCLMVLSMYPPKTIKSWAAIMISCMGSSKAHEEVYKADGMDETLDAMGTHQLPLETLKEMFEAMGLAKMTIAELIEAVSSDDLLQEGDTAGYLSGDLRVLEKEMEEEDKATVGINITGNARNPRNIIFAKSTLKYLSEGVEGQRFFASMGCNHLLGEYGYLNLMSALLGKPLLRFDDKTGEFVPGETYLDAFAAGREALWADLKTKGIEPLVA